MKKALFVYNPYSGDRSIPQQLDSILASALEHDVLLQPYHIGAGNQKLLNILSEENYAFLVVSGGDGTLNSIVNLLLLNELKLPVGIIPAGTCNDFARSLNLPASLTACLDIIWAQKITEIDLGLINGERYFLNTCGGGLFIDVSFNTDHELKKNFGPLAYYLKALGEVRQKRPFVLKIQTENESIEEEVLLFFILNGTHGGGFANLVGDASMSDGFVDIVLVKNCAHLELANLFFRVLAHEPINDKYARRIKAGKCFIAGSSDILLSIDGEKASSLPIELCVVPKALQVFTDGSTQKF